jgi:hypothetical protein
LALTETARFRLEPGQQHRNAMLLSVTDPCAACAGVGHTGGAAAGAGVEWVIRGKAQIRTVDATQSVAATSSLVKRKGPLTGAVNGPVKMGATGLEPVTPSVSRCLESFYLLLPMSLVVCHVLLAANRFSTNVSCFYHYPRCWLQFGYSEKVRLGCGENARRG